MYRSLIFLLITACASVPADVESQVPAPGDAPRTIHIDATATVSRAPDRAVIQLAVETMAATAGEATAANARAMESVLRAVRQLGVPESSIQTLRVDLFPRYDRPREGEAPAIAGYQATNQVVVTLDSIPLVGPVVDAAVRAGANRVTGIQFELRDADRWRREAIREAIAKARAEAEVVADALGERLGPALQVSTGGYEPPIVYGREVMDMAMRQESAAPPVAPGEVEVRATVSITFKIGP